MNHPPAPGYPRGPNPNFMPTPGRRPPVSAASPHAPGSQALAPHMRHYQPMISPAPTQQQAPQIQRLNSYSSHTPQAPSTAGRGSDFSNLSRYPASQQNSHYNASTNNSSSTLVGGYKAPQPIEVWSLNDAANATIPADIREQFQQDEHGRVLFFTAPPLDVKALGLTSKEEPDEPLAHSVEYLAKKAERDEKVREARKRRAERDAETVATRAKRIKIEREAVTQKMKEVTTKALNAWEKNIIAGTEREFEVLFGQEEGRRLLASKIDGLRSTIASSDVNGFD